MKVLLEGNLIPLPFSLIYFASRSTECWLFCAKIKGNKEVTAFHLWSHFGRHRSVINKQPNPLFAPEFLFFFARSHQIGIKNKSIHKRGDKIQNFWVGNLIGIVHSVDLHAWNSLSWSSGRAFPLLLQENKLGSGLGNGDSPYHEMAVKCLKEHFFKEHLYGKNHPSNSCWTDVCQNSDRCAIFCWHFIAVAPKFMARDDKNITEWIN